MTKEIDLKRPRMTELELHKSIAGYLDAVLTNDAWWSTIGHGGGGKTRGAILKGMGLKPGVPDILILSNSTAFWIELKTETGRLSPSQIECHADLADAGFRVATCRSIDDVRNTLRGWNIPIREKMVA